MTEYVCPNCQRPVHDDEALLCLYCGESLRRGVTPMGRLKYSRPKIIIIALILLVLLSFLLFVIRMR